MIPNRATKNRPKLRERPTMPETVPRISAFWAPAAASMLST